MFITTSCEPIVYQASYQALKTPMIWSVFSNLMRCQILNLDAQCGHHRGCPRHGNHDNVFKINNDDRDASYDGASTQWDTLAICKPYFVLKCHKSMLLAVAINDGYSFTFFSARFTPSQVAPICQRVQTNNTVTALHPRSALHPNTHPERQRSTHPARALAA